MQLDPNESTGAKRWFLFAGGAAVCLSIFLRTVDYRLSHSTKEQVLGASLREIRSAQIALPARVTDHRLTASTAGFARPGLDDATNPRDLEPAGHHEAGHHTSHEASKSDEHH